MQSESSLITVAMLSSFLSKENKVYLDLIVPFVLNLLPKNIGVPVDKYKLINSLRQEYGFEDIPTHVLTKILERCKKNNYLVRNKKEYYVNKVYDSTEFLKNQEVIKKATENVLMALSKYLTTNTNLKNTSLENTKNMLISFLEYYGFTVIKDVNALRSLTSSDRHNYHIARFIIKTYNDNSSIFTQFCEIVKGYFVYKSIYFFSTDQKKTIESNLRGTTIYFDTRLLIYALGYNLVEDKIATRELVRLIYDCGGKVKAFTHNKDEVAGILTKYARDPRSRSTMSLDFFDREGYDEVDIIRLRNTIPINLKKIQIAVVDTPEYGIVSSSDDLSNRGFLNLQELKDCLRRNLKLVGKNPSDDSLDNDVSSLSAISRLRGKESSYSIENCKAIFVTTNTVLVKTVEVLYPERFSKGEICFAINEIDLAALLWLKSFDGDSDMPRLKLLENAYAACCPSETVMGAFENKVEQLRKEDSITIEEALLMRAQKSVKDDIMTLTENNPDKITKGTVIEIKKRLVDSLTKKEDTDVENKLKELERYKEKRSRAYHNAEVDVNNVTDKYVNRLRNLIKLAFGTIFIVAALLILYSEIIFIRKPIVLSVGIGMVVINIVGIYFTFIEKYQAVQTWLHKKRQKYFDKHYKIEIEKLDDLFYFN